MPQLRPLPRARGGRHRIAGEAPVALCFPGQGSQAAGMADGLRGSPQATQLLDAAQRAGLELDAALDGDDDALRPTEVAQPALLFVECALLAHIPSSLQVAGVAGHSVGEYAAAVAAGALAPGDAMRLVVERGRAMAAMREGGMSAVLGIDAGAVEELCGAVREELGECVVVANLNAPGQVVVSGTRAGLDALTERARDAGARRVVRLNVSGAFHSPLMHDAAERFAGVLDAAPIRDPSIPIVCNVDAQPVRDADGLRLRLRRQLESPVRWADCVARLVELGAARLVEVGPGSVLTGLAKRIAPEVAAVSARSAAEATQLDGSAA